MRLVYIAAAVLALTLSALAEAKPASYKTVTFPSEDGIEITADLYLAHALDKPLIVLFHQAGWSRGEYREIAPLLNGLGFNAIAVDARSGKAVGGVQNETAKRAAEAKKKRSYLDALADLRASLRYARKHHAKGQVFAWGSSYSAALVVYLAGTEPKLADATLAFAPGEYFSKLGKSRSFIRDAAKAIKTPVFITSAKNEEKKWRAIYAAIPSAKKAKFVPKTRGNHGSRALWAEFKDSPDYWKAVEGFLRVVSE